MENKMPLKDAISLASSHPDYIRGLSDEMLEAFLKTACDALEESLDRRGEKLLTEAV